MSNSLELQLSQMVSNGVSDELPDWLSSAMEKVRSDPVSASLVNLVMTRSSDDVLRHHDLFQHPNTEQLLARLFESATTVRALALEIAALRGQSHTFRAEVLSAEAALNHASRMLLDAGVSQQTASQASGTRNEIAAEFANLSTWAGESQSEPPGNFYSDKNISEAANWQVATTGRTSGKNDDNDLGAWVRNLATRSEYRQRKELVASGQSWNIGSIENGLGLYKENAEFARLDQHLHPKANERDITLTRDVELRSQELEQRKAAEGAEGFNVQQRLEYAAKRYITERLILKIYIAALVSSIRAIPTYAAAYPATVLTQLEALAEFLAEMGDGADLVFECLSRIDLISKRIALNTVKGEMAFKMGLTPSAQGLSATLVVPASRPPNRLIRYIRVASLGAYPLIAVAVRGPNGRVAQCGSALPLAAAGAGELAGSQVFWNLGGEGTWQVECVPAEPGMPAPSLLMTIGYELVTLTPEADVVT